MKDPDIQAATASEPLTLEEEHEMQHSWRKDADKLTFIVCLRQSREILEEDALGLESMIGDVNLFISEHDNEDGSKGIHCELELMIAEKSQHGKGYGREALLMLLTYVAENQKEIFSEHTFAMIQSYACNFDYYTVKIGESNKRSIQLFEKLGFKKMSEAPNYFGEFELRHSAFKLREMEALLVKHGVEDYHCEQFGKGFRSAA